MPYLKFPYTRSRAPIVLIIGFAISALVAWEAERIARNTEYEQFAISVKRVDNEISRRISRFDYGIRGAASLWPASTEVTRADFSAMVLNRDLDNEFPGSIGLGFVRRVNRNEIESYLQKTRANGAPDFNIKTSGNDDEIYVVDYLVPESVNQAAIGYDITQEYILRNAADRAMITGRSAITAPIHLVQADHKEPSFLILFPVYEKETQPITEADRKQHLIGWTFMPIVASKIFKGSSSHIDNSVDFEVFHGTHTSSKNLIFDEDLHLEISPGKIYTEKDYPKRLFKKSITIEIGGQTWTVICSTRNNFKRADRISVFGALVGGGIITLLATSLIYTMGQSTRRAQELAKQMTLELGDAVKKLELLSLVATRTTNAVMYCDEKRLITWVNEGFTRMTGYTFEESIGKSPAELLQSEHSNQETILLMRQRFKNEEPVHCEILNRTKSNHEYWAELDIVPLKNQEGILTGFMSVQQDISERKHNEASIREQAERTAMALANGELGLWDWNIITGETLFDECWAAMLGEKSSEIKPSIDEWVNRCHPDDIHNAQMRLKKHLRGQTPIYESRHRLKHKDGTWRWVISNGKVVSWKLNGKAIRMIGTHRDITNQYHSQLESQRQQSALNHTGKIAKVGAWELSVPDMKMCWSEQVRVIHEVDKNYIPSLDSAISFYESDAAESIRKLITKAIELGDSFDVELPLITAKGNQIWVRAMGEAVQENCVTTSVHGAIQDVSDAHLQRIALEEARKTAEKASQAKAEFLANMSHEIRTPMNAVIGMSELLQHTRLNTEQSEFVSIIRNSSETLLVLINDILDFSKIESGSLELESIPLHIRDCAESASEIIARSASKKKIDLLLSIEPDVPTYIYGDKTRLCQIITNLLSNAVKFTESGEVILSISNVSSIHDIPGNDGLHFSVSDTGIGIPEDRQDRLFKTFSQVDTSTTREYGGTGLGLAICSRLVTLMQGRIWVDSRQNEGSTFHFEIPTKIAPVPVDDRSFSQSDSINGKRLLIVDDNATNRRILSLQVKNWGLIPEAAASGKEALALIDRGEHFDAAILDIQMPEMNGYQLTAEIQKRLDPKKIPMIALTSLGDDGKFFDNLSICKFLTKAVKSSILYDTLLQIFNVPKAEQKETPITSSPDTNLAQEHPFRILLCEDLPINQRVATLLLNRLGYSVEIAENGNEALLALEQQSFDIIFMDVQMPEMDGLTCTRLICEKYPIKTRPWIIAMTANAQEGDLQICLDAGMNDYISKPISEKAITQALIRASNKV